MGFENYTVIVDVADVVLLWLIRQVWSLIVFIFFTVEHHLMVCFSRINMNFRLVAI